MSGDLARHERTYHIRMEGDLDLKWSDWFDGFSLSSRGDGQTLLTSRVVDQAALHGILARINHLGIPLILVMQTDLLAAEECCPVCGRELHFDRQ